MTRTHDELLKSPHTCLLATVVGLMQLLFWQMIAAVVTVRKPVQRQPPKAQYQHIQQTNIDTVLQFSFRLTDSASDQQHMCHSLFSLFNFVFRFILWNILF